MKIIEDSTQDAVYEELIASGRKNGAVVIASCPASAGLQTGVVASVLTLEKLISTLGWSRFLPVLVSFQFSNAQK